VTVLADGVKVRAHGKPGSRAALGVHAIPGKPLAPFGGRPLLWHVHQRCLEANLIVGAVIATDGQRTAKVCEELDIPCVLTGPQPTALPNAPSCWPPTSTSTSSARNLPRPHRHRRRLPGTGPIPRREHRRQCLCPTDWTTWSPLWTPTSSMPEPSCSPAKPFPTPAVTIPATFANSVCTA